MGRRPRNFNALAENAPKSLGHKKESEVWNSLSLGSDRATQLLATFCSETKLKDPKHPADALLVAKNILAKVSSAVQLPRA